MDRREFLGASLGGLALPILPAVVAASTPKPQHRLHKLISGELVSLWFGGTIAVGNLLRPETGFFPPSRSSRAISLRGEIISDQLKLSHLYCFRGNDWIWWMTRDPWLVEQIWVHSRPGKPSRTLVVFRHQQVPEDPVRIIVQLRQLNRHAAAFKVYHPSSDEWFYRWEDYECYSLSGGRTS